MAQQADSPALILGATFGIDDDKASAHQHALPWNALS
jgi:hypothetical protein